MPRLKHHGIRSHVRNAPEAIETELRRLKEMEARGETARDIDASKRRSKRLAGFVREAWPVIEPANPFVHNWHIDTVCVEPGVRLLADHAHRNAQLGT